MRTVFCAVSLILMLTSGALAQSDSGKAEATILGLEKQMTDALLKGDMAASERYLAEDYLRVYPDGSVAPSDDLRNGLQFTAIEISEQRVRVYGDTAVSSFRAVVKGTSHGQPIDGMYRGVRTWVRERGEWRAASYASIRMEPDASAGQPPSASTSTAPVQHAHVQDNIFVSNELPKLSLSLDVKFQYLGTFPFDIRGVAGGYRYVWGEVEPDKHLHRVFIVQAEGYYPGNGGSYPYGAANPEELAGETYQHNVWIYDNDESARERAGNESDLTAKFMQEHGYKWEPQLVMSRYARVVDEAKKNEIIVFYFENLKDYTTKPVKDFPEEPVSAEQKKILEAVERNSRKAFRITH